MDIKIETYGQRHAGGIVGYCYSNSTISCTYATGDVKAGTGEMKFYAGGICGYLINGGTIENSLALNGRIEGGSRFSNRIVEEEEGGTTLTANYDSPVILVNGETFPANQVDNEKGVNTWLSSFKHDLENASGGANGWAKSWIFTDGSAVMSGTLLNLANTESDNYHFSDYLSGSDNGNLIRYDRPRPRRVRSRIVEHLPLLPHARLGL